ncbi:hypothetical protein [Streptomyces scabiei]|uniref:hypothetical protein n=1 Tax=Streptomyces scabiei TaxID=1930 RepID=UPI00076601D1|nr:hypothetical protein [Streptomyces scabiei]
MPSSSEIVEPGRYDYDLAVEFPGVSIPEHTPPAFRNAYASPTTPTRHASGQFDLSEPVVHALIRQHFVNQVCEDVDPSIVTVARFELTRVTA